MIVELLDSGQAVKSVSDEYSLNASMVSCWRREFIKKSGNFSKKKEPGNQEVELKELKKQLKDVTMERDILKKTVSIFSKSDR